jgi:hypothetical protein
MLSYAVSTVRVNWMYRSTFSLTSALAAAEWSASRPRRLYPRYPLDGKLGGPQSRSERRGEEKILDPNVTRTPTSQSSIL